MIAGLLEIKMQADLARLANDMASAKNMVSSSMQSISNSVESAKRALYGLGVAGAALSFANAIKGAIDLADSLNKLSQRTGIATENLSQLQYVAKLADVSSDSLNTAMKKLNVSIAQGLAGDQQKIGLFKALGITTSDLGKGTEAVMLKMADAFANANDGAGKTAVSVGLLGKAGDEMIPLLNGGADAIRALKDEANKLGLTISSDFAKQAEEFNDNLTRMQASGQKLVITLGSDLVTGLSRSAKAMAEAAIEGGKFAGVIAGLQTLLTGDDQHKNNVQLVEDQQRQWELMNALDKLRSAGYTADTAAYRSTQKQLDEVNARLRTTMAYRKVLSEQAAQDQAKQAAASAQQKKDIALPKVEQADTAYQSLNAEIQKRNDLASQELAWGEKLSEGKKFEIEMLDKIKAARDKLSPVEQAALNRKVAETKIIMDQIAVKESQKELEKQIGEAQAAAAEQSLDIVQKVRDDQRQVMQDLQSRIRGQGDELAALKLAGTENISLAEAVERVTIARKQDELAATEAGTEWAIALQAEIDRRKELLALIRQGAEVERFKSIFQSVDQVAQQAFTDILHGGKDAFQRLGDTIKTSVLDLLYQMTVRKWVFQFVGVATGASEGVQGAASGALGTAANIGNTASGISKFASSAFGSGFNSGLTAWGAEGTFSGALDAAALEMSLGNVSTSLGIVAGSLGPIALAVAGIMSLLQDPGGPKVSGSAGIWTGSDPNSNALDKAMASTVAGLEARYRAITKATGGTAAQFGLYASTDPRGNSPTLLGLNAAVNGQQVYSSFNTGVGRSQDELNAAITDAATRAMLAALKASKLDEKSSAFLAPLEVAAGDITDLTNALNTLVAAKQASDTLDSLGITIKSFTQLNIDGQAALLNTFGGLDAMGTALATFQKDFYSDAEQTAAQTAALNKQFQALGVAMPETKDAFRALVEGWDVTTVSGQQALVTLLSLSDAFAKVKDTAASAGQAVTQANTATLKNALSGAFDVLKASVAAEQKAVNDAYTTSSAAIQAQIQTGTDALSKLNSLGSTLKSTLNQMASTPGVGLNYGTAAQQLQNALVTARATGVLPDADTLQVALKVVAQPSTDLYKSFIDYARDFAKQAATISELNDITEKQGTVQQRTLDALNDQLKVLQQARDSQLSALDAILAKAQAQVDAANGTTTAVLSVAQALANFSQVVSVINPGTKSGGTGPVVTPGGSVGGFNPTLVQAAWDANPDAYRAVYQSALTNGQTLGTLDQIFGQAPGTAAAEAAKYGLPAFAVGTNYVPHDMLAMVHAGEEIRPAAYVRRDQEDMGAIADAIDRLNARLAKIEGYSKTSSESDLNTFKVLRKVTRDGISLVVSTDSDKPLAVA